MLKNSCSAFFSLAPIEIHLFSDFSQMYSQLDTMLYELTATELNWANAMCCFFFGGLLVFV